MLIAVAFRAQNDAEVYLENTRKETSKWERKCRISEGGKKKYQSPPILIYESYLS